MKFEQDMSKVGEGGIHTLNKDFLHGLMTLNFDLETLFKVTAHPLMKGTLWVKYEPDCV